MSFIFKTFFSQVSTCMLSSFNICVPVKLACQKNAILRSILTNGW